MNTYWHAFAVFVYCYVFASGVVSILHEEFDAEPGNKKTIVRPITNIKGITKIIKVVRT